MARDFFSLITRLPRAGKTILKLASAIDYSRGTHIDHKGLQRTANVCAAGVGEEELIIEGFLLKISLVCFVSLLGWIYSADVRMRTWSSQYRQASAFGT